MHLYQQIYEFAASVGAFEGYVYRKGINEIDMQALANWADNLRDAYEHLPASVRKEFQSSCDFTLGRALRSLMPVLEESDPVLNNLKSMIRGRLPDSPDDFKKKKWFKT